MTAQRLSSARLPAAALLLVGLLLASGSLSLAYPFDRGSDGSYAVPPTHFIRLKVGTFDPLAEGNRWVPADWRLSSVDPMGDLYIVQLKGPIRASDREAVFGTGARYHSYLPDNAYLVSATAAQARAISILAPLRSVTPFEPYYRVDPELLTPAWRSAPGQALVWVETVGSSLRLEAWARALGGSVVERGYLLTLLEIPRGVVRQLAQHPDAAWIEPWQPRVVDNWGASIIQGARQWPNGQYDPNTLRLWSYNPTTGLFEGYTGNNVTATVSDTGLDTSHPAFAGKLVHYDALGGSDPRDTFGHGTHTAGTVLGSGAWRASDAGIAQPGLYAGIAPDAKLVVEDWDGPGASQDNTQMGIINGRFGSVISSNSWASGSSYDGDARTYDRLTRDSWPDGANASSIGPQPVLYLFSAGNAGGTGNAYRIGSPGQGKNVIAVGATGDNAGIPYVSWDEMAGFSSRGPADDDRIKPELVAPGAHVTSSTSIQSPWIYETQLGTSYGAISGTSMSCPAVAGAAAVAWQFYRETRGREPSPEMIKGILVNGADEMAAYPVLGTDQGFGRVNLSKSLLNLSNRIQIWQDRPALLNTDDEVVYTYAIIDGSEPFAVTLTWTDEPANSGADPALVNDLDLWIVGPNREIYYGNEMNAAGESFANGTADLLNNVEKFKLNAPPRGGYEVHIKGKNVPVGPQDFALAIRGNIDFNWQDVQLESVSTNATNPIEGQNVTFNATVWNRGTRWANGTSIVLEATTFQGTSQVDQRVLPNLGPEERYNLSLEWTTVRGNVTFTARAAMQTPTADLLPNNNQANTSFFVRGYGYTLATEALAAYALDPGSTLLLTFNVTQTGNVEDNISVAKSASGASFPVTVDTVRISTLKPGKNASFHVSVIVPMDAKAQQRIDVTITTSSISDARYRALFSFSVVVNQLYGFLVNMFPNYTALPPTGSAQSSVSWSNTGNGLDHLKLNASGIPSGWRFTIDYPSIAVNDNGTAVANISIRAPDQVDAGTTFTVIVRAGSDGAPAKLMNFTITVTQVYAWNVTLQGPGGEVDPGTVIEIPILAQNHGNGIDNITIDFQGPPTWNAALTRPRLLLTPYSNLSSLARITVDAEALADTFTLRFTFGGIKNFTEQFVEVKVRQIYLVEVEGPGLTVRLGQGEVTTFNVSVTNLGNGRATVTPTVVAPDGLNIIGIVPSATLERNSTAKFTFQVLPKRSLTPNLYTVTVDFRYGPGQDVSTPLVIYVDVREIPLPPPEKTSPKDLSSQLFGMLFGVLVVVAVALPVGVFYLRRRAAKMAPAPEVIIQEEAATGDAFGYDPTKGYHPPTAGSPVRAPRSVASAPARTTAGAAMEFVGVCKNCGGGMILTEPPMGRCVSCGVEAIVRATKR